MSTQTTAMKTWKTTPCYDVLSKKCGPAAEVTGGTIADAVRAGFRALLAPRLRLGNAAGYRLTRLRIDRGPGHLAGGEHHAVVKAWAVGLETALGPASGGVTFDSISLLCSADDVPADGIEIPLA